MRHFQIIAGIVLVLLILAINHYHPQYLRPIENQIFVEENHFFERQKASKDIVLVEIDDETYKKGYFDRVVHAKVIEKLEKVDISCLFFDVIFDEPRGPEKDVPLVEAIRQSRRLVLAGAIRYDNVTSPKKQFEDLDFLIPEINECFQQLRCRLGLININTNSQESALEGLLAVQDAESKKIIPSASLSMFCLNQHILPSQIKVEPGRLQVGGRVIPVRTVEQTLTDDPFLFFKIPIQYHSPVTGPAGKAELARGKTQGFQRISYTKLVEQDATQLNNLRGKILVVGESSSSPTDVIATPVGQIKGFEVHAQILNTVIEGVWLERALSGTPLYKLNIAVILGFSIAFSLALSSRDSLAALLSISLMAIGSLIALQVLFLQHYIALNFTLGLLSIFAVSITQMVFRFEASRLLLRTFVPEVVANQLLATGKVIEGDVEATVIVTDIRGYTTLSETKTPREILLMLNEYHTETVAIFEKYKGNVLNYQGDAQIVIFGYPRKLKDAPERAIKAGLATADAVERLRKRWGIANRDNFDVGCGICTGQVSVGELGAAGIQAEYTVIGETVRLCHKVQSMSTALEGNVLMDEATFQACTKKPLVKKFENVTLEAIAYPVAIYRAEAAAQSK
jgi:class 3 adenylate cyclase/CHASE2 domain-containing sensor protein